MASKYYLPSNVAKLLQWFTTFFAYLKENMVKWGIDKTEVDPLEKLRDDLETAQKYYETAETRSPMMRAARDEAKKAVVKGVQGFVQFRLVRNPLLEDMDFVALGINKPSPGRHPFTPVPGVIPDFSFDTSTIRRISVYFHAADKKRGKPDGVHGITILHAILDHPPLSIAELTQSTFDTKSPCVFEFTEEQRGKRVYFCCCWENSRGEKGPWSEIMMAIIP
jgi:hypothetical protein